MSTTTSVLRAAIAYVDGATPATLGVRHDALVRSVKRYLARQEAEESGDSAENAIPSGTLPTTETRAFSEPRGVRRLDKSKLD